MSAKLKEDVDENTCNVEVIVNSEFNEEEKNDSQVTTENYSNADVGDLENTQPVDSQEKSQEETLSEIIEKANAQVNLNLCLLSTRGCHHCYRCVCRE